MRAATAPQAPRRDHSIRRTDGRTDGRSVGRARNPADLPIRIFKCTIGYISARSRIFAVAYLIRYTEVGLASTRAVKVRRRRRLSPSPEPVRVGPPPQGYRDTRGPINRLYLQTGRISRPKTSRYRQSTKKVRRCAGTRSDRQGKSCGRSHDFKIFSAGPEAQKNNKQSDDEATDSNTAFITAFISKKKINWIL